MSFGSNASLGTVTNGDVLDVWATHSLVEEEYGFLITVVSDGRVLSPEEYVFRSHVPLRFSFRPWATENLCGEEALDEAAQKGLLGHLQNRQRAEVDLTESSIELCDSSHWLIIFFHSQENMFEYYSHLTFGVRQAPAFDAKILGNHVEETPPMELTSSDIKPFSCARPVWDAEDLPWELLHSAVRNGMDGSFRFTSHAAVSKPHGRHSDMRLELQAVSCCMVNGALMFHGSSTALRKALVSIDSRLQAANIIEISDPMHHFNQEAGGGVHLFPTEGAYSESQCAHVMTKTTYLFSAASFSAAYWYVLVCTCKYTCWCAHVHACMHACMRACGHAGLIL